MAKKKAAKKKKLSPTARVMKSLVRGADGKMRPAKRKPKKARTRVQSGKAHFRKVIATAKRAKLARLKKRIAKKTLKKMYPKRLLTGLKHALQFPVTGPKKGKTVNIPVPRRLLGTTLITADDFAQLQKQVAALTERVNLLTEENKLTENHFSRKMPTTTIVDAETGVKLPLPLFDAMADDADDTADLETLPPGITLATNGNVEIDPDETWRWTEADMLNFVRVGQALNPPALAVHTGRPRKMRKVLFDWMREQGLEPTDLPPKGAEAIEKDVVAGFTGPREGMTAAQAKSLRKVINNLGVTEWHHGDCLGADEDSHEIARQEDCTIVVHPPAEDALCAKTAPIKGQVVVLDAMPYHKRNHAIVDAAQVLVATPESREEELHSGTWATIRYARKTEKPIVFIWPDGKVEKK